MTTKLTEENLKYNFVFLFAIDDYWRAILGKELYHGPKSRVYRTAFDGSSFMQKLFHYHWAYSLNLKIRMPFKKLWFKRMYNQDFSNDLPLCFVFMGGNNIRFAGKFCNYIRRKDSRNKIVVLHNDLISKHCNYDYNEIKDKADLITTYDKDEAEKYNIEYFQETTYSKLVPEPTEINYEYDIYFLGSAKDRLERIHDAYKFFTANGLRCKFVVVGVPKEKQIDGVEYSDGIPYEDSLKQIIKSRCVLEIIQGGSSDITTRALEAIAYRKKFITDCPMVLSEFFNEKQLFQFKKIQDVDIDALKEDYNAEDFDPKIDLNPLKRLYFMQDKLESKDEG